MLLAALALALLAAPPGTTVQVALIESHTNLSVTCQAGAANASLDASLPIPYRGQTPLAIRSVTRPAGKVAQLSIVQRDGNPSLHVTFEELAAGETLELDLVTQLMSTTQLPSDGRGVKLCAASEIPAEIRPFLEPAAGIESKDERILKIGKEISRKDLAHAAGDVLGWLGKNIQNGSGPQGALAVLERKSAACTGYANLGAAIFIAAGIPARILPNILVGAEQQEHYIVEVWTRELGWSKVETSGGTFPLGDSLHVVLRIMGPEAPRSSGGVPIVRPQGSGVEASFRMDAKYCMQGATRLGTFELDEQDEKRLRESARAAFEELARRPAQGPAAMLIDSKKLGRNLGSQARKLVERIE